MSVLTVKFPPFELHPGQLAFVQSVSPENCYSGGFGAGKSTALIVRAVLLAHQFPNNKILITRKTYRSLSDTTRASFYEQVPVDLIAGESKTNDLTYIHAAGGGTSTIFWRSFEDSPSDWQKFRSTDYGHIFVDEASEAAAGLVDILVGRLRTPVPFRSINFVTNPVPEQHWLYLRFNDKGVDKSVRRWFIGSTYENRSNLPPGYIENLEAAYADRPEMIEILLKGKAGHIPSGLPVFRSYRRTTKDGQPWHFRPNLEPEIGVPILRGWDFGTVRPACVWMQITDRKRILREKLGFNSNTRDFGRYITEISTEMFPGFEFVDFCDPQGFAASSTNGKSDVDELRDLMVYPVRIKKTNPGWRAGLIEEALKRTVSSDKGVIEPEFQVDSSCSVLDGAFIGGYRRAEVIPDQPINDEPVKDGYFEHLVDAMGFVVVGRLGMGQSRRGSGLGRKSGQHRLSRSYGG